MGNFKIQNSNELKNENISLWKTGKRDIKKFYEVKLKRSTNIKTFLFGILITLIIMLPLALLLVQFYKAYIYNLNLRMLFLLIGWIMVWFCNGLSNYFTVKLAKKYFKEEPKLQNLDEVAILYYETLNPGFIIFTFFLLIFVFLGLMGA